MPKGFSICIMIHIYTKLSHAYPCTFTHIKKVQFLLNYLISKYDQFMEVQFLGLYHK